MATTTTTTPESRGGARVRVQQFGTFLSNMIMPNIGAIIAWGLITAFFIDVGWTPNDKIALIVEPTIYLPAPAPDRLHRRQDRLRHPRWCRGGLRDHGGDRGDLLPGVRGRPGQAPRCSWAP